MPGSLGGVAGVAVVGERLQLVAEAVTVDSMARPGSQPQWLDWTGPAVFKSRSRSP